MSDVLTELLDAGLLDRLDGDDARFAKLERAAHAIADHLHEHPRELVQAVLAGLDPDVAPADPSIQLAKRMLQAEWKSVTSVYPSEPVGLLRAILLAACAELAEKHARDASILWLTAADILPLRRLGKEESVVRSMLTIASKRAEETATTATGSAIDEVQIPDAKGLTPPKAAKELPMAKVDRTLLLNLVAAAAGPNGRGGPALQNANPHWSTQAQHWSHEFADRMTALIADTTDAAIKSVHANVVSVAEQQKALVVAVTTQIGQQQQWVKNTVAAALSASRSPDRVRLDALWWSEALYSDALQCSYRELQPVLAAVLMALELEAIVSSPPPASVGYLLAETVHRLPGASFDRKEHLVGVLDALARARDRLPPGWTADLCDVPREGSVSVRDVVMMTLSGQDLAASLKRARIVADYGLALPHLAHAVFRQQHAVRLAAEGA